MARVAEWFPGFFKRHTSRIEYPWPEPGSEDFDVKFRLWLKAAVRCGATEVVADEASERLAMENVRWEGMVSRFVALVGEIFGESVVDSRGADPASDRASAEDASKGCVECSGAGTTHRYRHNPRGDGTGKNAVGAAVIFYCNLCPYGRWLKSAHRQSKERVFIPDLADFLKLQLRETSEGLLDNPNCHKPGTWDVKAWRPVAVDLDAWRKDVGHFAGARRVPSEKPAFTPWNKPAEPVAAAVDDGDWTKNP